MSDIEKSYNISLLIQLKYHIVNKNIDNIHLLIDKIKNNLLIEYIDLYIYILSLNKNNQIIINNKYTVFDILLDKYTHHDNYFDIIMLLYLKIAEIIFFIVFLNLSYRIRLFNYNELMIIQYIFLKYLCKFYVIF